MKTKFSGILALLLVLVVQLSFAQQKTVTGTVNDDQGLPLPGANVIIKGSSSGTQTDFDGNYSISAAVGQTLIYSYVGFDTVERNVSSNSTINVDLTAGASLGEVVITAFGIKRTRNEVTGNVVTINAETIEKTPFTTATQALQGKVAGLNVNTTSGTPGASQEIRIRGVQSVTASNEPLYVIDGIPVSNSNLSGSANTSSVSALSLISPSNIESITVLKDAVSTAPYGASGSNGVILITTKSGKRGEATYTLSATTGIINNASDGLTPMNGEQKEFAIQEGIWNSFGSGVNGDGTLASRADIPAFIEGNNAYAQLNNWNETGRPNVDWRDAVENKDALLKDINLSVSQGFEKSRFYASLGYNGTEATVIGSNFERITGSFKFNSELNEKLRLGVSINASNARSNGSLENGAFFSNPNLSKYFLSPWIKPYNNDGSVNLDELSGLTSLHNTVYTANENIRRNDVTRAIQSTELSYDILDNLTAKTVFNIDYAIGYYKGYDNPIHGDGQDVTGRVTESAERQFNFASQNQLDYSFSLGEKNNFQATALMEYAKYKTNFLQGVGENFPNEQLTNLSATSANQTAFSSFTDRVSLRYVGLVNYDFDKRYVLNATYSYQGDSRFSEDQRFDDFYSIGAAWNLHKESFMGGVDFINTLRIKGGYGITGNAGIARNQFQSLASFGQTYNGQPGAFIGGYGTTAGWETGTKRDIALDFGVMDNRISGTFGYFSNTTSDMLLDAPLGLSATFVGDSGAGRALQNIGEMTNKGYEFEMRVDAIRSENFELSFSGNFATLENEVTFIPEESSIITGTRVVEQGYKVYEWYLPEWAGVDPANGDPLFYTDETLTETTNDIDLAERVYQGTNALPTYSGGFGTRIDTYGFFVEADIFFAGGNEVYEDWAAYTQTSNTSRLNAFNATTQVLDGAWLAPGDNATHPRFDFNDPLVANAAGSSTRFLYEGDYVRLKNLAIGYNFDSELLEGTGFTGAAISLRGTNMITWVKDDRLFWDPEVRTDGFTNLTTPPTKTIALNVNLKF